MSWFVAGFISIFIHALVVLAVVEQGAFSRADRPNSSVSIKVRVVETVGPDNPTQPQGAMTSSSSFAAAEQVNRDQETTVENDGAQESKVTVIEAVNIDGIEPRYPRRSIRYGEQGRVIIEIYRDDSAINYRLFKSSGYGRLDRAAMSSLVGHDLSKFKNIGSSEQRTFHLSFNFNLSANKM